MEDGQSPPDADKRADSSNGGERAPRSGLRLRDAEAVATTRRDMFGDGSLLDALAPQNDGDDFAPSVDAEAELEAEVPDGGPGPDGSGEEPAPEAADVAPEPPPEGSAESLDAIIDSFPAEPSPPTDAGPASEPHADPSFLATSAFSFREPRLSKEPGEADQPPAAVFERYQVSSIFQSLSPEDGRPGRDPEATPAAGEAPPPDAAEHHEPLLPPSGAEAPSEAQGAPAQGVVEEGEAEPPEPDAPAGAHGLAPALDLNMWPPLPSASADEPGGSAGDEVTRVQATDPAPRATMPDGVSMPDLASWPPFPEPPGAHAPGASASDAQAAGVQADAHQGNEQYLGTPAWPPFPELPGGEADVPPTMPAGLPPYFELPATPEAGESDAADAGGSPAFAAEAEADSRYADDVDSGPVPRADAEAGAPYPGAHGVSQQTHSAPSPSGRYPGEDEPAFAYMDAPDASLSQAPQSTFAPSPFDTAARASNDATAKIAAEANATAQALDNLQRLLDHSIPPPEAPPPPAGRQGGRAGMAPVSAPRGPVSAPMDHHDASLSLRVDPPGFRGGLERYLPLPLPSSDTDQGRRVYLLGFATGLVLSVVAGIALYILIALGN